jgi:hypothetical protein
MKVLSQVGARIALVIFCSAVASGQTTLKVEVKQAVEATVVKPTITPTLYRANLVLPDGSHAKATCLSGYSADCGLIESFHPEHMKPDSKKCGFEKDNGLTTYICTVSDLGNYDATREGNDLVIVVPAGTVRYHIDGSW